MKQGTKKWKCAEAAKLSLSIFDRIFDQVATELTNRTIFLPLDPSRFKSTNNYFAQLKTDTRGYQILLEATININTCMILWKWYNFAKLCPKTIGTMQFKKAEFERGITVNLNWNACTNASPLRRRKISNGKFYCRRNFKRCDIQVSFSPRACKVQLALLKCYFFSFHKRWSPHKQRK